MLSIQSLILIVILVLGAVGVLIYFFTSQINKLKEEMKGDENTVLVEWLKTMKTEVTSSIDKNSETLEKQMKDQRETLENQLNTQRETMSQQTKMIWERLDTAKEVIMGVQKQLGGIQEFGQDMKDLSNVLKSPKLRGGLGEQFLYEILANYLPNEMYRTQYKFKDGSVCDAVVFTEKGMIPIDSKFSLENFKLMVNGDNDDARAKAKKLFIGDVKKRIDEISSKYILPDQGTIEQAIMYVPSESIYYELVVNTAEIVDYSKQRNIFLASPSTLSYLLGVILIGYQKQTLQKNVNEILKSLTGVRIEAEKYIEEMGVLERHISNAYKAMESVKSRFMKLFGRIESLQAIESKDEEPRLLE